MRLIRRFIDCLKPGAGLKRSLEECERRFDEVFDAATIGMAVISVEGRFLRMNEAICAMFGYSRDELLARNIMELTHPDDLQADRECMQNLLSGAKQHCHFEKRYIRRGGIVISVIMSAAMIRDENGEPLYFLVQIEDISERDRAEKELLQQLKVMDSVVELSKFLLASSISVADISDIVLEHAKRLTGSAFGFVAYIDPKTGYMVAPTLSRDVWDQCLMEGKNVIFSEFKGLWGWVLDHKEHILCNDLKSDHRSTGIPKGHIPIKKFLGVPVVVGDVLLGQIGLANPKGDYTERDLFAIGRLADIYGIAIRRRREEDELLESTSLLFTTLMSIGDAVISTNPIGNITFMNDVAQAMTGWTVDMAAGRHVDEVVKLVDQRTGGALKSSVERALATCQPVRPENHTSLISRWGKMYSIDHNASPIKDHEGNVTGSVLVFRDVTKERETSNMLAESEKKYRLLVQNINEGIWVIDKNEMTTYVNPAMASMLGYTMEEMLGRSLFDLMDEEWKKEAHKKIEKRREGVAEVHDFIFSHKSGRKIYTRVATSPIYDEKNEYMGAIAAISDMTKTRLLDKLKDEFISTVSHELRTPLSITKEGIALVLDGIPGTINEKQAKILGSAMDSADRLARIVNELLDISRLESGDMVLNIENVCINSVVSQVAGIFNDQFLNKGLKLGVDLPETDVCLNADSAKLAQILTSLLDNALKFTSRGGVKISVEDMGDHVKCCVSDTGVGIAEEDLSSVFSKFRQYSRTPGAGERGTGLGLAIIKGLVDLHRGTVAVESKKGEGSRFCFTLPKT